LKVLNFFRPNGEEAATEEEPLSQAALGAKLLDLANKSQAEQNFEFNRFEHLSMLNLLHTQHRSTRLDEEIEYSRNGNMAGGVAKDLQQGLEAYSRLIT
jgi:hypothetical protein